MALWKNMHLLITLATIALQAICTAGVDLNSILGRTVCFDTTQESCNKRFVDAYPQLSKSVTNLTVADTYMLLFTSNRTQPELLHECAGRLPPGTNFNSRKELIVIFVPFNVGFCDVAIYREWLLQFFKRGDYNIIIIDYSWGNRLDYETTVLNMKLIVKYQVLILLNNIQDQIGGEFVRITFVGHSLGAQLAALVAAAFPVDRIIGLDPAGPAFSKETALKDRLDPSDARLVEVWHSNAGDCLPFLGINYEAGHVNFYINGGSVQKACTINSIRTLARGDFIYALLSLIPTVCWHKQVEYYFKVSINPEDCQFVGVKCESYLDFEHGQCTDCGQNGENCLIMGWDTAEYIKEIPTTPQVYFVKTTLHCPYCDNRYVKLDGYRDIYQSSLTC